MTLGVPGASEVTDLSAVADEVLVARWVAQDHDAFDELVRRYTKRVYGICFRYFGDRSEAEDAAQDAFVSLMRRASTFQGTASFSTWMYRVAVNACNDLARKRGRRPRNAGVEVADMANDLPSTEDIIGQRELGMVLEQALTQLDPETREAIVLHDVQGVPYHDIAERLGMAVGTVKSRIHRGHARLAVLLTDVESAEGTLPTDTTSKPVTP